MANIIEANEIIFDDIISGDKPVLVLFWVEWAGPCKMIMPSLELISEEYDETAVIARVNIDDNPRLSMKYSVRSVPTIVYFKDGRAVDKIVGIQSKLVISQKLAQLL